MSGFCAYVEGMKDLISHDQKAEIAKKLIYGESPLTISTQMGITVNQVLSLLGDGDFSAKLLELFKTQAKGMAYIAHQNIARIAFDPLASPATQLKASKILVDIARELEELHPNDDEPANMSQSQLANRLKELQKEAIKRALPVDTGVIEAEIDIESML